MSEPYTCMYTWHTRHNHSMFLLPYLWIIHTNAVLHTYICISYTHTFSHGNENGCLTHVTFIISCDLFLRLQFGVPVTVLIHPFILSHFRSSFRSRSLFLVCQSFSLNWKTKNYPTASVIPWIREHMLYACSNLNVRNMLSPTVFHP